MISIKQAAALLAVSVTSFRIANDGGHVGPMPVRFGKRVLFVKAEFEKWIAAGCPPRVTWLGGRR